MSSRVFAIYKHSHLYAYTCFKWLAELFLLDRNDSYNIKVLKIKNSEFNSSLEEYKIHYFYGYAVISIEKEFVEYMLSAYYDTKMFRELYRPYFSKKKHFMKFNRNELVPQYIQDMIQYAINHPGDVNDKIQQKQFLESMKGW